MPKSLAPRFPREAGLNAVHVVWIALIVVGCGSRAPQTVESEPTSASATESESASASASEPEPESETWVDVSVGYHFSCAVRGGRVWCWGSNAEGRAGLGDTAHSPTPMRVEGVDDALGVSAGESHACALRRGGRVACWGRNRYGQVGDGTTDDRARPVAVDLVGVAQIETGRDHTCARLEAGTIACWGRASLVGDGTDESRPRPTEVAGVANAIGLAVGTMTSCAWNVEGDAWCWGYNTAGLFERRPGPERAPRAVLREDPVEWIAIGNRHACFTRKTDHVGFCAGDAEDGQLGNQNVPDEARCERDGEEVVCTWTRPEPPREHDDPRATRCCPHQREREPRPPPEERRYPLRAWWLHSDARGESVTASDARTCFLTDAREVACVGNLYYTNDWGHRHVAPIEGTAGTVRFDVDRGHGCALRDDGELVCWGDGRSGNLGDGTLNNRPEARPVRSR